MRRDCILFCSLELLACYEYFDKMAFLHAYLCSRKVLWRNLFLGLAACGNTGLPVLGITRSSKNHLIDNP